MFLDWEHFSFGLRNRLLCYTQLLHHLIKGSLALSVFLPTVNDPGNKSSGLQAWLSLPHTMGENTWFPSSVNIRFFLVLVCLVFPIVQSSKHLLFSLFMQFELMWVIVVVRGFPLSDGNYPFYSFIPNPVEQYLKT